MQKKTTQETIRVQETIKVERKYESKGRPVVTGQPEALATFAASARNDGSKPENIGLEATTETTAISTNLGDKHDAATKVLREGVLGTDQGADQAIDRLPDRVTGKKPAG